jgi:N-acetylglucosamine-6-phosphate deacetylase
MKQNLSGVVNKVEQTAKALRRRRAAHRARIRSISFSRSREHEIGAIAKGHAADLVVLNGDLDVEATMVLGSWI